MPSGLRIDLFFLPILLVLFVPDHPQCAKNHGLALLFLSVDHFRGIDGRSLKNKEPRDLFL